MNIPVEVLHRIIFLFLDDPRDLLSFVLTSKTVYNDILGVIGSENAFDVDQFRAMAGVVFCAKEKWWRAAKLAYKRGFGDINQKFGRTTLYLNRNSVFDFMGSVEHIPFMKVLLDDDRVEQKIIDFAVCLSTTAGIAGDIELFKKIQGKIKTESVARSHMGHCLQAASQHNHVQMAQVLFDMDESIFNFENFFHPQKVEILELFLKSQAFNPSSYRGYVICGYCENNDFECVEMLLKDTRVDPGCRRNYCIKTAVQRGYVETVKLLLQHPRVDPTVDSSFNLRYALEKQNMNMVNILMEDGRCTMEQAYAIPELIVTQIRFA